MKHDHYNFIISKHHQTVTINCNIKKCFLSISVPTPRHDIIKFTGWYFWFIAICEGEGSTCSLSQTKVSSVSRSESGLLFRGLRGVDRSRALLTREPSVLHTQHRLLQEWLGMYTVSLLLLFILWKNKTF